VSWHRIVRCIRTMKEHADYEVFCAEHAHSHYGKPFTVHDHIYYWLRGDTGGFMECLLSTINLLDSDMV